MLAKFKKEAEKVLNATVDSVNLAAGKQVTKETAEIKNAVR